MLEVLGAQDCLVHWYLPVDSQGAVLDGDSAIGFRSVEVVAFVLEDCGLTQYGKAMSEASRHEELTMIIFRKLDSYMLSVGWRTFADVYSDIKHLTLDASYKFTLGIWRFLEMKAAHYSIRGHAFVVLDEVDRTNLFVELSLGEGFEEIAAIVFEDAWLYDY